MSATYATCWGMRGERTARGGKDGVTCAAQSYDGSVIVSNEYVEDENGKEQLRISIGTNEGSSCYRDCNGKEFCGTFDELKALLKLNSDIKHGRVSVVRHRQPKE